MSTRSEHVIKFRSDFRQFKSGFAGAQRSVSKFAGGLGRFMPGMGALAGGAAIIGATASFGKQAGQFRDLNRRTEIAVEDLQRLKFVADQTGTSLETFVNAYERLQKVQRDAARGSKQMVQAFKDLGIDPTGMAPGELFARTTEALRGRPGAAGIARELMGRSGGEMLQSVNQDIGALMKQAKVIDADMIERAATNMDALTTAMNSFTTEVAPLLSELLNAVRVLVQAVGWLNRKGMEKGGVLGSLTTAIGNGLGDDVGELSTRPGAVGDFYRNLISVNKRTNAILEAED